MKTTTIFPQSTEEWLFLADEFDELSEQIRAVVQGERPGFSIKQRFLLEKVWAETKQDIQEELEQLRRNG